MRAAILAVFLILPLPLLAEEGALVDKPETRSVYMRTQSHKPLADIAHMQRLQKVWTYFTSPLRRIEERDGANDETQGRNLSHFLQW